MLEGSLFSTTSLACIVCMFFLHDGHSDWCEVISHCDFDLHSLVAQMVKNLPAMQETPVQSLGKEYLLEKEMATHSSILLWEIPWTEKPGGAIVHRVAKNQT